MKRALCIYGQNGRAMKNYVRTIISDANNIRGNLIIRDDLKHHCKHRLHCKAMKILLSSHHKPWCRQEQKSYPCSQETIANSITVFSMDQGLFLASLSIQCEILIDEEYTCLISLKQFYQSEVVRSSEALR